MKKDLNHNLGFLNTFPEVFFWKKDIDSNFLWVNERFSKIFGGINNPEGIIGMNDCHLFEEDYSSRYQEQDREIILINNSIKILETIKSTKMDEKILCITTKIPKHNDQNIIIGTYGYSIDITSSFSKITGFLLGELWGKSIGSAVHDRYFIGQKEFGSIKLTPRESECLFFYLRNRTSKEIARILNIAPKTVDYYINNVKEKLGCRKKSEIFDKAMEYGFLSLIPDKIFNEKISIILRDI